MPTIPLSGGFYEDDALQFDAQRCVNMYQEIGSGLSKSQSKLSYTPGLIQEREIGVVSPISDPKLTQPISIYKASNGILFTFFVYRLTPVNDIVASLEAIDEDGNVQNAIETITSDQSDDEFYNIKMIDNGFALSIVATSKNPDVDTVGFLVDINTFMDTPDLQDITDPDFPTNVIDQEYKDGYFIWLQRRANLTSGDVEDRFYISNLFTKVADEANCVNALDFGVMESSPDAASGIERVGNEIAVFGDESIEYYYNSGNVDFPFERNNGVTQNVGTQLINSIRKINNVVYFIGSDKNGTTSVFRLNGYIPERITTHAIERRLSYLAEVDYSEFLTTRCYSYEVDGHYFYCIKYKRTSLQTRYNSTVFVYDATSNTWSENVYLNGSVENALPIVDTTSFLGRTFALSELDFTASSGGSNILHIYSFSKESLVVPFYNNEFTLQELRMPRIRNMQHISQENKNIIVNSFELDVQKGLDDGNDPSFPDLQVSISKDGGETYETPRQLSLGQTGDYLRRVRTKRLGRGRDLVFKIESKKKIKQEWFNAYINYEVLGE